MRLKKAAREQREKFRKAFQQMLERRGIAVQNVDASSGPENERQRLARHRDERTRLGRGTSEE